MKISHIRLGFLAYLIFLFILLELNNFSLGDLNSFFFFYFIQLVILLEAVNFILKRLKLIVDIKPALLILLIYTAGNSLTLAYSPQLREIIFNRFGHIISGVIYTLMATEIIKAALTKTKLKLTKPLYLLFVFSFASTAGVFNEIIELLLDIATGSHRIGPGFDTAIDLLMNTVGILLTLLVVNRDSKA